MKLVFIETPLFTRLLPEYLDDQEYQALQLALLENPQMGDIMPGTGGFRKIVGRTQNGVKVNGVASG